jgi:RNA polymerase sigma-70 factor (ECF subfamily)
VRWPWRCATAPRRASPSSTAILARGDLRDYHLAHAARADFCRRLGKTAEARASYERAIALARQEPERRFLEQRVANLPS